MLVLVTVCLLVWICVLTYWRARFVESHAHPLPPVYPGYLPIIGHTHIMLFTDKLRVGSRGQFPNSMRAEPRAEPRAEATELINYNFDGLYLGNVMLFKMLGISIRSLNLNRTDVAMFHTIHSQPNGDDAKDLLPLIKDATQYSLQQGGLICGKIGSHIYYFITDPEDTLLVSNTCLEKHFLVTFAKCMLGEGLITGSGHHWRRHRELLKSNFSLPIINSFLEVFNSQSRTLLSDVECYVGKGQFYLSSHLKQFALASSYLTTFGKVANENFYPKYMKAVDELLVLVVRRFQKFWLQNDFIYKLLGEKKKESELVKTANEVTDEILQTKRSVLNGTNDRAYVPYQPVIDLMLEQNSRNNFTDQEITEELHTYILASFETTAHSLETILVMIGSFPKVQEKIYEEIMQVLGTNTDIHKNDLRKLVYTDAVIKESLRVLPTVPVTLKFIDRDVKLKNYTLRAGSQCVISQLGLLHHPSWGPDVEVFRPERWLDTATLPAKITDAAFGIGKRSCLGKIYAMTSMKIAIAHMVRKYIITADHTKLRFIVGGTIKAQSGHEISLQRRMI